MCNRFFMELKFGLSIISNALKFLIFNVKFLVLITNKIYAICREF